MSKKVKRFKIQRSLNIELPGLGKSGALERRPYPPGEHGAMRRRAKRSEFGIQLMEKQKMFYHYQISERQLRRFIRDSKRGSTTNWMDTLVGRLERRLDNVLFRLGLAPSIRAARQLCVHRHVFVNGRRLTVPSAVLEPGDTVRLSDKAYTFPLYLQVKDNPPLELPEWLEKREENGVWVGELKAVPSLDAVPFPFESRLVVEYYSKLVS